MFLYLPFWGHGEIIHVIEVNPNTMHNANSLYEFVMRFYSGRTGVRIGSSLRISSSQLEGFTHTLSYVLFLAAYGALCLRAFLVPKAISSASGLIRWLALAWLLYCLLGSPWFWPWYIAAFLGLFALIEADGAVGDGWSGLARFTPAVRALAFTMVSVYCFYTWAPSQSIVRHVFHEQFIYLRGLWLWLLPGMVVGALLLLQALRRKRSLRPYRFNGLLRLEAARKEL
jgi:hypothetical protein